MRPFLKSQNDGGTASGQQRSSTRHLSLDLRNVDVQIRNAPAIRNVSGQVRLQGGDVLLADLTGQTADKSKLRFKLSQNGRLQMHADHAGAFLDHLGLPGQIRGGRLALNGNATPDFRSITADLKISEFEIVDAPVMMRVLQLASISGPLEALAQGSGLKMEALEAPFSVSNRKLRIKDGHVYGGSLGVTFRGEVDIRKQRLDMRGAVVPIYVMNRILRSVPLLGDVLTGGDGVFAVSYTVKGPLEKPQIATNPLSLLAPGGLRRLLLD